MAEEFLMNSANKNDFNEVLAEKCHRLYRGDQIYILSYRDPVNQWSWTSLDDGVSIRKSHSEEADQQVMHHTLQCVCQQIYKQIVVRTIDADVLILQISHLGSFTSHDTSHVNVYAEMINSSIFHDMEKIIAFL